MEIYSKMTIVNSNTLSGHEKSVFRDFPSETYFYINKIFLKFKID